MYPLDGQQCALLQLMDTNRTGILLSKGQRGNGIHCDNSDANQKDVHLMSKTIARKTINDTNTGEILVYDKPLK